MMQPSLTAAEFARLPREGKVATLAIMSEFRRRTGRRCFYALFPEKTTSWAGPRTAIFQKGAGEIIYSRHLYPKHMAFIRAGRSNRERCLMSANRVGKTILGCYEDTCHATGHYPPSWDGFTFNRPTDGWIAGKTFETTRDILQRKMFGDVVDLGGRKGFSGTGMVPGDLIGAVTWKGGIQDLADTVQVKHIPGGEWSGAWSRVGLKSYQQGRGSFEGVERDWIHPDEEPPMDIYGEMLIRVATTGGIIYITFTPLEGLSEVVLSFLPADMRPATEDSEGFNHMQAYEDHEDDDTDDKDL